MSEGVETLKRGTTFPQIQQIVEDYDPVRGLVRYTDWNSAGQTEMAAIATDYQQAGIAYRLTFIQDKATLAAQDSTQQFTLDTWQIVGNNESRDGLSHPSLELILGEVDTPAITADLRKRLDENQKPSALDPVLDGYTDDEKATIKRFYSLQQRGSTDYLRSQYVLRHTTNAPNFWSQNIADFNVGYIYSPAQLLSECQNSALWIYPLPGRLAYKIANIPVPTFRDFYQWGWLKSPSTETTAANNRIEITTEFVLEQFSTDYYPPLS